MSICLTCFQSNGVQPINSIHDDPKIPILELISYCITIKIEINKDYPDSICDSCISTLTLIYKFKQKVLENLIKLENAHVQFQDDQIANTLIEEQAEDYKIELNIEEITIKDELTEDSSDEFQFKGEPEGVEDRAIEPATTDRPFQCPLCEKRYKTKNHLKAHEHCHSNVKHQCPFCEKFYLRTSDLNRHKRVTHANFKPIVCPTCSKTFSKRWDFKVHQRTHTGERPFKCELCALSFAHNSSLRNHLNRHPSERKFKCAVCTASFIAKAYLKEHLKGHRHKKRALEANSAK